MVRKRLLSIALVRKQRERKDASFSFVFGLGLVIGVVSSMLLLGAECAWFIDYPALLMVVVLPMGLGILSFGFEGVATFFRSFGVLWRKPSEEELAPQTEFIVKSMMAYTRASGVIATFLGLVMILQNLDDPSMIGPGIAVGILSILYAAFIADGLYRAVLSAIRHQRKLNAQPLRSKKTFPVIPVQPQKENA